MTNLEAQKIRAGFVKNYDKSRGSFMLLAIFNSYERKEELKAKGYRFAKFSITDFIFDKSKDSRVQTDFETILDFSKDGYSDVACWYVSVSPENIAEKVNELTAMGIEIEMPEKMKPYLTKKEN